MHDAVRLVLAEQTADLGAKGVVLTKEAQRDLREVYAAALVSAGPVAGRSVIVMSGHLVHVDAAGGDVGRHQHRQAGGVAQPRQHFCGIPVVFIRLFPLALIVLSQWK